MTQEKADQRLPEEEQSDLNKAKGPDNGSSEVTPNDMGAEEVPAGPDTDIELPSLEELRELRRKATEYDILFDRLKRVTADYLNAQKRLEREMQERANHAIEAFALELLPVADNLARAIQAAREHATVENILDGVQLVEKQLHDALAHHGVTPVDAECGHLFDPTVHEAIGVLPSDEYEPNRILEEIQKGFQLHERLLRPSRVVVSKPPEDG